MELIRTGCPPTYTDYKAIRSRDTAFFVSRSRFSNKDICQLSRCQLSFPHSGPHPDSTLVITSRRVARPTLLQLQVAPHATWTQGHRGAPDSGARAASPVCACPPREARGESQARARPTPTSISSSCSREPRQVPMCAMRYVVSRVSPAPDRRFYGRRVLHPWTSKSMQ